MATLRKKAVRGEQQAAGGPLACCLLLAACCLLLSACDWGGQPPAGGPLTTTGPALSPESTGQAREVLCLAADLKIVAGWQGAGGAMAGGLSFINRSAASCALHGRPGIHLIDANGDLMPVANVEYVEQPSGESTPGEPPANGGPVVLRPGAKSFVYFVWRNWCGHAAGPFKVAVALPGEGGQLTVPVQDPQGAPVSTTPRCDDPGTASTISVGQFK